MVIKCEANVSVLSFCWVDNVVTTRTAPSYLADELEYTADFEIRRRLRSASSLSLNVLVHGCPPSVIGPSLLLLSVLGTVSPNMSRPHLLYVFFPMSPQVFPLLFSGVLSMTFTASSACAVTVVIFGHLNRSFYSCTYLLTYLPQIIFANSNVKKCFCCPSFKPAQLGLEKHGEAVSSYIRRQFTRGPSSR